MSELLKGVVNDALPFASSVSGYIILIVLGLLTLLNIGMAFGVAYISTHAVQDGRYLKRLMREAVAEELTKRGSSGT